MLRPSCECLLTDGVSVNYSLSNVFNEGLIDGRNMLRKEYFMQTPSYLINTLYLE